ncbi:hypothetical protein VB715_16225 [Crocosphaera sp. UHCC 0190]|uniref:hypothetical protein n=1 Tax=Crocosphaera sp. UHCC 0190 TaxID=3110246 RepID=UPI002B1EEE21|nr:hypothetical protein [Crocosphaera sp. UHCC 0190]MEA5511321.1 hypothetical protein [Crocosphaera sp. UHCC 0190]
MPKPTQAHITRSLKRKQSTLLREKTKNQIEYYMGAKLIEVGINPKSAIYRWSLEMEGEQEIWTYSAYWGQSKEQMLSGQFPLTGTDLINCARANAEQGIETTAKLCGYGEDIEQLKIALKQAGEQMGITLNSLGDLLEGPKNPMGRPSIEVAPNTNSSL